MADRRRSPARRSHPTRSQAILADMLPRCGCSESRIAWTSSRGVARARRIDRARRQLANPRSAMRGSYAHGQRGRATADDRRVPQRDLAKQNPVFVHLLGMCPVLAVTNTAMNALAMGLATAVRPADVERSWSPRCGHFIPKRGAHRHLSSLVIATFVTIVDYLIQAISLDLHKALGAFISLIVVNCLILGRAEAFASKNGVVPLDRSTPWGWGSGSPWRCCASAAFARSLGSGSVVRRLADLRATATRNGW